MQTTKEVEGMEYGYWQKEFWIEIERKFANSRRALSVYLFHAKAFTHYYKKGQSLRGATVGTLTSHIMHALRDKKFKFVPMVDPSEVGGRLVGKNRSDVIIELARKYGVPSFPIAATDKVARWFILPTKGFNLYLQAHGLNVPSSSNQLKFSVFIEISCFPEGYQRKLLARCALNGIRWRRFGGHVFVPLGAIFTEKTQKVIIPPVTLVKRVIINEFRLKRDEILDVAEPVGSSVDTIVKKGFRFFREAVSRLKVTKVDDSDLIGRDASEDGGEALREILNDALLVKLMSINLTGLEGEEFDRYGTLAIDVLQMYCEHVAAAVFGGDEGYWRAYVMAVANTADDLTSYAFKKNSSDLPKFDDGDPSVRLLVAERQRLTARIYKRQKNHAYRDIRFKSKEEPAPLLRKFIEHAKNLLVNKFMRLWTDETGNKTGVTIDVAGERVRVAILREYFDDLMERLSHILVEKFGQPVTVTLTRITAKSWVRWLIETFGIAGFKAALGNVTGRFKKAFEWSKEREESQVPHFVAFVEQVLLPQTVPR